MRCLSVTGKIHIRWDASSSEVVPATPADVDPEDARVQLARRFVHWFGPVIELQFAEWADSPADDAKLTWAGMRGELTPVSVEGTSTNELSAPAWSRLMPSSSKPRCAGPERGALSETVTSPFHRAGKLGELFVVALGGAALAVRDLAPAVLVPRS